MNQDFGLSLKPATARRLIRIQQVCNVALPENLIDLALQDRIGENAFDPFVCPCDDAKLEITQFLLDCNLRGIVQRNYHLEFNEMALLNAIRHVKPNFVTIYSDRHDVWKDAAAAFFVSDVVKITSSMTNEEMDERRSGILIFDGPPVGPSINTAMTKLRNFGSEFPRTLVFDRRQDWNMLMPWNLWAQSLWPTMPNPLYPRIVKNISEAYNKPLHMFAPLYNVCMFPELMEDAALEHLNDKYLHSRLQQHRYDL